MKESTTPARLNHASKCFCTFAAMVSRIRMPQAKMSNTTSGVMSCAVCLVIVEKSTEVCNSASIFLVRTACGSGRIFLSGQSVSRTRSLPLPVLTFAYTFSKSISSVAVLRLRRMVKRMPRPTATSAAATMIIKIVKTEPVVGFTASPFFTRSA